MSLNKWLSSARLHELSARVLAHPDSGKIAGIGLSALALYCLHRLALRRAEAAAEARALGAFHDKLSALGAMLSELRSLGAAHAQLIAILQLELPDAESAPAALSAAHAGAAAAAAEPVGPPVTSIFELGDGATPGGWCARHVHWAARECTLPAAELGYELVCSADGGAREVSRRELEPGLFIYRRSLAFSGVPAERLTHYLAACVGGLDSVRDLVGAMTRLASSRAAVTITELELSPFDDGRARSLAHWHTYVGPLMRDRETVIIEELVRADRPGMDGARLPAGWKPHALLLQTSTHDERAPPRKDRTRVEHYTCQLIAGSSDGQSSALHGCYVVDMRGFPSLIIRQAAKTLGEPSSAVLHAWVVRWHSSRAAAAAAGGG